MAYEGNTVEPTDRMLLAIGAFALNWATMEMGLDFLAATVWHQYGGKAVERENPKNLGRKVSFLESCMDKCASLAPVAEAGRTFLAEVTSLTNTRHHLIHGAPHAVLPDESLVLLRLSHDKRGFHSGEEVVLTLDEVETGALRAKRLAHQILGLGLLLESAARTQYGADQAGGERAV